MCMAQDFYDERGNYKGKRDDSGNYYDDKSNYLGREDSQGNFYDQYGNYKGRRTRNRGPVHLKLRLNPSRSWGVPWHPSSSS